LVISATSGGEEEEEEEEDFPFSFPFSSSAASASSISRRISSGGPGGSGASAASLAACSPPRGSAHTHTSWSSASVGWDRTRARGDRAARRSAAAPPSCRACGTETAAPAPSNAKPW